MTRHVVIVGGGVIGSAIASFVLRDPAFRGTVSVVERDPTYARASSALSASSIRQQFSTAVNVEIGRHRCARPQELSDGMMLILELALILQPLDAVPGPRTRRQVVEGVPIGEQDVH